MKMRLTPPDPAPGAWLIAGRSAAGAVLLVVVVSACSGGGSGSSVPSIFTPTSQTSGHATSGTRTPSPAGAEGRRPLIRPLTQAVPPAHRRTPLLHPPLHRPPRPRLRVHRTPRPRRRPFIAARPLLRRTRRPRRTRRLRRSRRPRTRRPRRTPAAAARRGCRTACYSGSAAWRSSPASAPFPTADACPASSVSANPTPGQNQTESRPTASRPDGYLVGAPSGGRPTRRSRAARASRCRGGRDCGCRTGRRR